MRRYLKKIGIVATLACMCVSGGGYAAELTVNKIAAVVNGEMITQHEVERHAASEIARLNLSPSDPRIAEIKKTVLESMITNSLLRQEAQRMKVTVSDNEIDSEIRKIMQQNKLSPAAFEQELTRQGGSIAMLKERLHDNALRQRMISFMIARRVVVTEEEIAKYYETHKSEFTAGAKTASFSVIVFPPSANVKQLYSQLKAGALGFEDAARKYSIDASAKNGGNVGQVSWASMSPNLHKVLESLKDGEISPLLKFDQNQAVVRRNAVTEGGPQSLEDARGRIEETLREPRLQERFKEYSQQLRSKAVVDVRM